MKAFLLLLNLALLGGVLWSFSNWLPSAKAIPVVSAVSPRRNRPATPAAASKKLVAIPVNYSNEQACGMIVEKNIFDPARCPAASTNRGGRSGQLQLVGIFEVGGVRGAVISEKGARVNTRNQTKQSTRNGAKVSVNQFGEPAPEVRSSPRQYYRLGDTLKNGYTLSLVERDRVLLTRGSGKMELFLEDASVNQPPTPTRQARVNSFQRLINAQTTQVQQQQRLMQMLGTIIRQNFQNSRNPNTGGTVQLSGGSRRTAKKTSLSSSGSSSSSSSSR